MPFLLGQGALASRLSDNANFLNPAGVRFQDLGIWSDIERMLSTGGKVAVVPDTNDPAGEGGYASAKVYSQNPDGTWTQRTTRATHYATAPKGTGLDFLAAGIPIAAGAIGGFLAGGPPGAAAGAALGTSLSQQTAPPDTRRFTDPIAQLLGSKIPPPSPPGSPSTLPPSSLVLPGIGQGGPTTPGIIDQQPGIKIPGFGLPKLPGGGWDWGKVLNPPSSGGGGEGGGGGFDWGQIGDWLLGKGGTPETPAPGATPTPGTMPPPSNSGNPGIPSTAGVPLGGLSALAGAGLLGAGLATDIPGLDPNSLFAGAEGGIDARISAQMAAEQKARDDAEARYKIQRSEGMRSLEDIFGQGTNQAMDRAVQTRQEQLNRQGLLSGPSGAMNFALAQEAANVRRQSLPALAQFQSGTSSGLENLLMGGVSSSAGLGRTGMEKQFDLTGQQRQANLLDRLMGIENAKAKQKALIGLGGTAIGYGLGGGLPGAEAGRKAVGGLEGILGGM